MKKFYMIFIIYLFSFYCLSLNARDDHSHINVSAPGFSQQQAQNPSRFQSAFTDSPYHELNNRPAQRPLINNAQAQKNNQKKHKQSKKEKRAELTQKSLAAAIIAKQQAWAAAQQVPIAPSPQSQVAPPAKKSNILSPEMQRLHERNKTIALTVCSAENNLFQQVMNQRSKAFESSINNPIPTTEHVKINAQTANFLQAQGMSTAQFAKMEGLPIQHQLTHELVDVLDAVADYAQHHQYAIYQTHLTKYCAHLASLSQQSNMQGALQQAIDGTNCCHGIEHYLKGLVGSVEQAYQQFQTAVHYFQPTLEEYALLIEQHALQSIMMAKGLEVMATAGMIAAPTATVAATGMLIGAVAYVMAPICLQAMVHTGSFVGACIKGDWDKVAIDLDDFGAFLRSKETVARMAEFAGGAAVSTPHLSCVIEQVLSLRPVITSVQNASGDIVRSFHLMTKNLQQKVYAQGVELLQHPDFINFNMLYKKTCGVDFFHILPQNHPALAGVFTGIENGLFSAGEQAVITSLFTQAEESVAGNVIRSSASSMGSQAVQVIEQGIESLVAEEMRSVAQLVDVGCMTKFFEILQNEIAQALQQPITITDLTAKITDPKYGELKALTPQIRQLQDLAKYTDNFKNLENLIVQDICYLNRLYELQPYRDKIKNFLDTHKPYFMYEEQAYFIEDIASYHIHAGDYYRKDNPGGAHSNYGGHKLDHFKPTINKHGPLGTKDVIFYNSRLMHRTKPSSIYAEIWSEFVCDLKAIEVMTNSNAEITLSDIPGVLKIQGFISDNLEIIIFYDIKNKRIRTHYPNIL